MILGVLCLLVFSLAIAPPWELLVPLSKESWHHHCINLNLLITKIALEHLCTLDMVQYCGRYHCTLNGDTISALEDIQYCRWATISTMKG